MGFLNIHQIFAISAILLVSEIAAQSNYAESTCACRARKYLIIEEAVTFFKAIGQCRDQGMELASPQNVFEQDEVVQTLKDYVQRKKLPANAVTNVWLGAHRCPECITPNGFIWLNTGKPILYSNFSVGNPDLLRQECIRQVYITVPSSIYFGGAWDDIECSFKYYSLCQFRCCNN